MAQAPESHNGRRLAWPPLLVRPLPRGRTSGEGDASRRAGIDAGVAPGSRSKVTAPHPANPAGET